MSLHLLEVLSSLGICGKNCYKSDLVVAQASRPLRLLLGSYICIITSFPTLLIAHSNMTSLTFLPLPEYTSKHLSVGSSHLLLYLEYCSSWYYLTHFTSRKGSSLFSFLHTFQFFLDKFYFPLLYSILKNIFSFSKVHFLLIFFPLWMWLCKDIDFCLICSLMYPKHEHVIWT